MTNKEIITAIEEWVEDNEWFVEDGFVDLEDTYAVESRSLITFLKKLLHE